MFKNKLIHKKNILISGLHCVGKSLLLDLIHSMDKTETVNKDPILTLIASLSYVKKISYEAASYLIRSIINNIIYSNGLGRKINLRLYDETSILKSSNPEIYFDRMMSKKKTTIEKNNYNIFDVHNVLIQYRLWENSVPNFKLIHLERHPVDVVESVFRRKNFVYDEKKYFQILTFKENKKIVPFYLLKKKLNNYSLIDLTIEVMSNLYLQDLKAYKKLSSKEKKNIIIVKYENLKINPKLSLNNIKKFLGLKFNKSLKSRLDKEQNTQSFIDIKREKNLKMISKIASKKQIIKLYKISKMYEKNL